MVWNWFYGFNTGNDCTSMSWVSYWFYGYNRRMILIVWLWQEWYDIQVPWLGDIDPIAVGMSYWFYGYVFGYTIASSAMLWSYDKDSVTMICGYAIASMTLIGSMILIHLLWYGSMHSFLLLWFGDMIRILRLNDSGVWWCFYYMGFCF